jgi:hypothetical protein
MMMNPMKVFHKQSTYFLMSFLILGLIFQLPYQRPLDNNAVLTKQTIYDYDASLDQTSVSSIPTTTNMVLGDANNGAQSFTVSIGAVTVGTPDLVTVGHVNSTTLSGTSTGQFVVGSPTLLSLATTTNLTSIKRLYGIRVNANIDLTYYEDISITWGWQAGGDAGAYTGFLATSIAPSIESWSVIGNVKQSLALSTASSLSFLDTTDILTGQATARFAFIFGSELSKVALRNFSFIVEGYLRTSLTSVSDPGFLHVGRYQVNEAFLLADFTFHANYLYRIGGNMVHLDGTDAGVSLSFSNTFSPLILNGDVFATAGTYTLYYRYVDPNSFGTQSASVSMIVDNEPQVLTGIFAVDALGATLYRYGNYLNNIDVYPLYNNAITPAENEAPVSTSLFTTSMAHGTLLLDQTQNVITYDDGVDQFTDTLTFTVLPRTGLSINVTGGAPFTIGQNFSLSLYTIQGLFDLGPANVPAYLNPATEGYFETSIAVGTALNTLGTFPVTFSYLVNETTLTTIVNIEVILAEFLFFGNLISGTNDWGATTTPVYGNQVDVIDTLTNSIDVSTSLDWKLNTLATDPLTDNGRMSIVEGALRFGHNSPSSGPYEVTITSDSVVEVTLDSSAYNGIKLMRVDLFTETIGTLTVTVGGIYPSSYAINDNENPVAGSLAPTVENNLGIYYFWLPYHAVGVTEIHYDNNLPQPGYMELNYFEMSGAALTTSQLTDSFASMLNDSDSCVLTTYDDLLPSYDYLTTNGAVSGLSAKTMTNHGSISATSLWNIIVDRYAVIPMGLSSFTAAHSVDYRFYLSIFFIFIATLNYFVQYGNHDHHRVVHTVQTKKKKAAYKILK